MPPLPNLKDKELLQVLFLLNFVISRQKGSHLILRQSNGKTVVLPIHQGKDIPRGTLRSILRQADISVEQLLELLKQ